MKRKSIKMIYATVLSLALFACNENENAPVSTGKMTFAIQEMNSSGARQETIIAPNRMLITLKDIHGEEIKKEANLLVVNDLLTSDAIVLPVGSYEITSFLVLDDANKVLYATPVKESVLSSLVNNPLPYSVDINSNQSNSVNMQVVNVAGGKPEDFGLIEFPIEIIETIPVYINTVLAKEVQIEVLEYTMRIDAYNATDEKSWSFEEVVRNNEPALLIPTGYETYEFTVSNPNHVPHRQRFNEKLLEDIGVLKFELIDSVDLTTDINDLSKPIYYVEGPQSFTYFVSTDPCKQWKKIVNTDWSNTVKYYYVDQFYWTNDGGRVGYDYKEVFTGDNREAEVASQGVNALNVNVPYAYSEVKCPGTYDYADSFVIINYENAQGEEEFAYFFVTPNGIGVSSAGTTPTAKRVP